MTTYSANEQPAPGLIGQSDNGGAGTTGDVTHGIKDANPHHDVVTPEPSELQSSSPVLPRDNKMTGKKIASLQRPDDDAKHLASLLTLEEKVFRYMPTDSAVNVN